MTTKRRRQVKLVGEVFFNLLAIGFGLLGIVVLVHHIITPELRNIPFDSTLDPLIGHLPTLIFYLLFLSRLSSPACSSCANRFAF